MFPRHKDEDMSLTAVSILGTKYSYSNFFPNPATSTDDTPHSRVGLTARLTQEVSEVLGSRGVPVLLAMT